jgi:hypothetical protein
MRFLILVKASEDTERGAKPAAQLVAAMATFHEELARAGALLDASGLHPSAKGWRVRYSGSQRTVIDGPFTEAKELIAGYTLIQAKSIDEAREWSRRFPNPAVDGGEAEIEVRPLFGVEDYGPSLGFSPETVERFRKIGIGDG